jgi:hypothetical protein
MPRNAIRLSEAFELYYRSTASDAAAIDAELFAATEDWDNYSCSATETQKRWNKGTSGSYACAGLGTTCRG